MARRIGAGDPGLLLRAVGAVAASYARARRVGGCEGGDVGPLRGGEHAEAEGVERGHVGAEEEIGAGGNPVGVWREGSILWGNGN